MRTTPEFILDQPSYHFAAFVRGTTAHALSIGIPFTDMNKMPRMTRDEWEAVRGSIRERYAAHPGDAVAPSTPPPAPPPEQEPLTANAETAKSKGNDKALTTSAPPNKAPRASHA